MPSLDLSPDIGPLSHPDRELLKWLMNMATLPYFIFSPSTILSMSGLYRGPDTTRATPVEDWREATIDVIIPALNEADNIVLCLASVLRQTVRPRRIMLIDDGSTDGTVDVAKAFCEFHGVELVAIQRRAPIGKTPTIKRQARELNSDVEFILDGDTVLESDNYIERTVQELFQGVGIASAFGTVMPQRTKDRRAIENSQQVRAFAESRPVSGGVKDIGFVRRAARGITNMYRDVLYAYLQRFIYRGQIVFFGTTSNPIGCAVAYRRKYVRALFDYISPILGDDLTNSEDVFIGFSMLNEGYRNVQVLDVCARTVEPEIQRLPRQVYLWSSSFLQSCYYFDSLLRSPFKVIKRWRAQRRRGTSTVARKPASTTPAYGARRVSMLAVAGGGSVLATGAGSPRQEFRAITPSEQPQSGAASGRRGATPAAGERRVVGEAYRQAFGRERTEAFGRPAGWILLMSAIEKVFFPTTLLIMVILQNWHGLAITLVAETAMCLLALSLVMKGQRLEYVVKGLAITPIRYGLLACDLVTIGRFASDLWITKNRKWRK